MSEPGKACRIEGVTRWEGKGREENRWEGKGKKASPNTLDVIVPHLD